LWNVDPTTSQEGGVREPAFIRWKGTVAGGRMSHVIAATYDIFATILSLAGVAAPEGVVIDGKDLTAVLRSDRLVILSTTIIQHLVLLHCCIVVLLYWCIVVLLYCCVRVLLYCCVVSN
jgi:hypothetical protein